MPETINGCGPRDGVLELICGHQKYDWGKTGSDSLVYRLASGKQIRELDASEPHAELWMGTHPSLPSLVEGAAEGHAELKEFMTRESLGKPVYEAFRDLPFLFKVLSIRKPLSIQSHPDQQLARKLHSQRPEVYKDPNHKPEMVVGITLFRAFVGFKEFGELKRTVLGLPELQAVIGKELCDLYFAGSTESPDEGFTAEALRMCAEAILFCDKDSASAQLESLSRRLLDGAGGRYSSGIGALLQHYPQDPGCLFALLLNYVELQPGEAVFLPPNEPHCYVSGDGVECMATSDNVIRIGCTPKYRDLALFCESVSYKPRRLSEIFVKPETPPGCIEGLKAYVPPVREFFVRSLARKLTSKGLTIPGVEGPSIVLVLSEKKILLCNREASMGSVFFVPACSDISLEPIGKAEEVFLCIASSTANA